MYLPEHFRTADQTFGCMVSCRQMDRALYERLRYTLIPVAVMRTFENFGVRSCSAYGRQVQDREPARVELYS